MKFERIRRFGALLLALALTVSLLTVPAAAEDLAVTLDQTALTLECGESIALTATVTADGSAVADAATVWTSSNTSVCTVENGLVSGIQVGTATVTVSYTTGENTVTAKCSVTVEEPPIRVTGLTINETENTLAIAGIRTLYATVTPSDATEEIEWTIISTTSDNVISLTPAADGRSCRVTANSPGEAIIQVAVADKDSEIEPVTCKIAVSGIVIEPTSATILAGDSLSLTGISYGDAPDYSDFEWLTSNNAIADISNGKVTGYYPGTVTITATAKGGYRATCIITVEEDVVDAVIRTASAGVAMPFTEVTSELNELSEEKTGAKLKYVSGLQVSTSQGVLYYGYVSSDEQGNGVGNSAYYRSPGTGQLALGEVSFVPNKDFSGTAVIYYSGRSENGSVFDGTIRVEVESPEDLYYDTTSDQPVRFSVTDFSNICLSETGRDFTSMTFTQPSSRKGVLYYNYDAGNLYNPKVSSDITFYRTKTPCVDDVVFVPEDGFTGTVEIPYYCKTTSGIYSGKVTIAVTAAAEVSASGITYSAAAGGQVTLDADDFNDVCKDATGAKLSYVYFDLPSSARGMLYYKYGSSSSSQVSSSTRYYRSSTPKIDNITFVAASNFTGSVTIPYTGYSTDGESYDGEVIIKVSSSGSVISYRSSYGEAVEFNGDDFNELCQSLNGRSLNYVTFEQPSSSRGTLYRGTTYTSSKKVSESTKFYRSGGTYQVDDVVFLPNSSFVGTAEVSFTGYDTSGSRFSGTVQITVEQNGSAAELSYRMTSGGVVDFDVDSFDLVCQLFTGERLNYVKFTLPSSSAGKLYYEYDSDKGSGTSVTATTKYYRTGSNVKLLNYISFRAADKYTGTVSIAYTGESKSGSQYSGTVEITVSAAGDVEINYTGSSLPITLRTTDFQNACLESTGRSLSCIRFTELPSASAGKLYQNYATPMRPGTAVTVGTSYYVSSNPAISQITFVPKAGYQGYVNIPFTGVDTTGRTFSGTLRIQLSNSNSPSHFSDLSSYKTEQPSIEYLYACGVVNGYNDGTFGPGKSITRGEFTVMLYRAFELPDAGSIYSFTDVSADSYYAKAVAAAKALGIVQGYGTRFGPQDTITRQDAMTMVLRAMEATGMSVTTASTSVLSACSDGSQVALHAQTAVSTLLSISAVDLDAAGRIRPTTAMTRAEMAVMLHRVFTQ